MKKYIKSHKISIIFALLTFGVMVLIFCFSHQAGDESSSTSSGVTLFIVRLFYKGFDKLSIAAQLEILSRYSFFVRKAAHFSIFAALGVFSNLSIRFFYKEKGVSLPRLFLMRYSALYMPVRMSFISFLSLAELVVLAMF